jgi:hypothetical protein
MAEPLTGRHFTDKELETKAAVYGEMIRAGKISAGTTQTIFTPGDYAVLSRYLNPKEKN